MSPLPLELINEILSHCTNGSLARCALTSNTLLDISRSHLYRRIHWVYQWDSRGRTILNSVAAHPYLLSHTRHLSMDFSYADSHAIGGHDTLPQLVNDLRGFGKLKYLIFSPLWSSSLRFKPLFLSLVRMPSLISISLSLFEHMDSPCFLPVISSPKLRRLSLILATSNTGEGGVTTPDFVILNPSLKFLFHSPDPLDLSNVRHLVITFIQAEVVTEYMVKLLTACSNVTHLTLSSNLMKVLSSDEEDIPALFIPIQQLLSLKSLKIITGIHRSTVNKSLDKFHFICQQVPPKAPLQCIILAIHWTSIISPPNIIIKNHPTFETIRSILKSRHVHEPPCQLEIRVQCEPCRFNWVWV